jgi:alcohol dehydrogenase (cytochrome c)
MLSCRPLFACVQLPLLLLSVLLIAANAEAQPSDLPDGQGKDVVQRMCTQCHSLSVVTGQRMPRDHWAAQVEDMVSRGAKGSPGEIQLVIQYLSAFYGDNGGTPTTAPLANAGNQARGSTPAPSGPIPLDQIVPATQHAEPEEIGGVFVSHQDPSHLPGVTPSRLLQADTEPQNWLTFNGTYRSNHYTHLNQITPENVKKLELKWIFQAHWLDPYEATPIVADGVLYTTQGNDVVALDAETGRMYWIYRYTPAADSRLCCGRITRGLAIHGDTLYLAAVDAHLVAIDLHTGNPLWDTHVARTQAGYTMTGAPLVVRDHVIVGVAGGEYGIRGFVASYNAYTGKQEWKFYSTAGPGDPGGSSWKGDTYKIGGGSVWLTGSYDAETNFLIWGVGNAGPDYNGDQRPGDNLYTSSMVAIDADTGKLKWHYQANPHNEYDWDAVQTPLLVDMQWKGQLRKVLLWANRNGFFYVLDRTTGKFLLGTAFVKQNWNAGFDQDGRPIMTPNSKSSEEGTLILPDNQGGTNWFGASYSPRTGLFYVSARDGYSTLFVKGAQKYTEGERYDGRGRRRGGPSGFSNVVGSDMDKFLAIRALEPATGERKWQYILNSGLSLNPFGGWQTNAGASGILTTGSDLLFVGGREGNLVALDARNGKELWRREMGAPMIMDPISYSVDGKQYFAINAGFALYIFGLPEGDTK